MNNRGSVGSDLQPRGVAINRLSSFLAMAALLVVSCAGPSVQRTSGEDGAAPRAPTTLRYVSRFEAATLAARVTEAAGTSDYVKRPFNAGLAATDGQTQPRPVLAERLPELNSESWRVFADGTMETTYRLRAGLTWHDGQPLTAEDFVFAWRVYRTPSLPFAPQPQDLMEAMEAPDSRTVVIRWSSPFAQAGGLTFSELDPLPAHLLGEAFRGVQQDSAATESFINLPFWSREYIGAGPYRLERREPGSFVEGVAFEGYALGKPKIDRVLIRFMGDENTVLTNLLAGELDFTPRLTLRFEHGSVLRDWMSSGRGKYIIGPDYFIKVQHQFRPEYQTQPMLLDVRVRRAMNHSVDRQALVDGIFEGQVAAANTWAYRSTPYFEEADRAITKYPYDPRRTDQLLQEAGMRRGPDGMFANPDGRPFRPDFVVRAGTQHERGQAILVDTWRRSGLDVQPSVLPDVTVPRVERYTWPNIQGQTSDVEEYEQWATSQVGTEANRWIGSNRAGYSNPEFDRIYESFRRTLDRAEAGRISVQALKFLSDELPGYVVYESPALLSHSSALRGVEFDFPGPPETTFAWNIHEWEFAR
jgi:peptide/nickel transport system substrate-binding protein